MIVFLAGFLRDADEMMSNDESFKDHLIKYFSCVAYCSALDEKYSICTCCGNHNSLDAVDICETAYMNQSRRANPGSTSQSRISCSLFGGDNGLRYSVNEMRKRYIYLTTSVWPREINCPELHQKIASDIQE